MKDANINGCREIEPKNLVYAQIATAHIGIDQEEERMRKVRSIGKIFSKLPIASYKTGYGAAYLGDALEMTKAIPSGSINLIMTSPPFALIKKKPYGNVSAPKYIEWFLPFADEFWRVLKDDGSLVIHIGGSWEKGQPVRSLYHFELLIRLCRNMIHNHNFYLAQDFYWYNPAKLPSPAEWVTVNRYRVKDAVDPIWWLSKSPLPKANNMQVPHPYSKAMRRLLKVGYNEGPRPSGHVISSKFQKDMGAAISPNLLVIGNTVSNSRYLRFCRENGIKAHPARYPVELPRFFIKFLTDEKDIILDPFAGSNATGEAAELEKRKWISFEKRGDYLKGSIYRFEKASPYHQVLPK